MFWSRFFGKQWFKTIWNNYIYWLVCLLWASVMVVWIQILNSSWSSITKTDEYALSVFTLHTLSCKHVACKIFPPGASLQLVCATVSGYFFLVFPLCSQTCFQTTEADGQRCRISLQSGFDKVHSIQLEKYDDCLYRFTNLSRYTVLNVWRNLTLSFIHYFRLPFARRC